MTPTNSPHPTLRDFHGWQCWTGLTLALGGFLAAEWPAPINVTPLTLLGGLLIGMGVTRNRFTREAGTSDGAALPASSPRG